MFCFLSWTGYPGVQGKKAKKKLAAPNISLTLDRSDGSLLSDELDESTELDLEDIDTPSDNSNEFEWEGETRVPSPLRRVSQSPFWNEFPRPEMQNSCLERQRKSWLLFSALGLICIFCRVFMLLCWRLSPSTAVKMCLIVLCFHTAAFLFFWEEMFPRSVWKQAAGQLQVSLFLVVRLLGLHIYFFFFFPLKSTSQSLRFTFLSPTNHAKNSPSSSPVDVIIFPVKVCILSASNLFCTLL